MNWNNCISNKRIGRPNSKSSRTDYQRDYDRIIFSSSFRRLQDKTQVFPLPGNTFVHNRLTHSLEVASVGRTLGSIIGELIVKDVDYLTEESKEFYLFHLSSVIAAACLAHDMGNPPFGHSGEDAISNYFKESASRKINGVAFHELFERSEWNDLINFEGNANALHILTHGYPGKSTGGLALTSSTISAILKYPCASLDMNKSMKHRKKYGYFMFNESTFKEVCENTNMIPDTGSSYLSFKRHPFVYLVEAADDICYRIIDIEDAHRINILNSTDTETLFLDILNEISPSEKESMFTTLNLISDQNERIGYLRAKCINALVSATAKVFDDNKAAILAGEWNDTLFGNIEDKSNILKEAKMRSIDKIYNDHSVIQIEIAGYNIIYELLNTFVPLVLKSNLSSLERKIHHLIPSQYRFEGESYYSKVIGIIDFIAGMTDGYATEYYKKVKGISLG